MIALFSGLCKTLFKKLTDEELFTESTKGCRYYDGKCPHCGALGKLYPYGSYVRNFVYLKDGRTTDSTISPLRFKCASCKTTHALLPDIITPYSPYSLRFKLTVMIAYFERNTSVAKICESFGVAISTLYVWKKLLLSHTELLIALFIELKSPVCRFIYSLLESGRLSDYLCKFYRNYAFIFLKERAPSATRSVPP